jgi:phosphatidylinositol alpha-1,6-mannosyltransferase
MTTYGADLLLNKSLILNKIQIKFGLMLFNRVTAISRFTKSLIKKYSNKKVYVIPPGIDPSRLYTNVSINDFKKKKKIQNKKVILSIGDLVYRKGIDIIIKTIPEVIKEVPNLHYIIIGKGSQEQELKNLVKELRLENYITFVPYANNLDLSRYYKSCDLFLLMSNSLRKNSGVEGFGIVYVEASYFGKPVIAGKSGGTSDAVIDNKTGYLVDPKNKKQLLEKITRILKDKKLSRELGSNGVKHAANLTWGKIVRQYFKIYEEII